jgi:hypothetical protein
MEISLLPVLRHYFAEEVKQAWIFVTVGLLAVGAALWLWRTQSAFRFALWPLLAGAAIQIGVGAYILARTPEQQARLEAGLLQAPAQTRQNELDRLSKMLDALRFYKLFEIALLLCALGLALFLSQHTVARGVALGLLVQSAFMLAADLVAEQRTEVYLDALRRL